MRLAVIIVPRARAPCVCVCVCVCWRDQDGRSDGVPAGAVPGGGGGPCYFVSGRQGLHTGESRTKELQ